MTISMSVAARPGAILDGAFGSLARVEADPAFQAGGCAAIVTDLLRPRSGCKRLIADATRSRRDAIGKPGAREQVGILLPETEFRLAVATRAERDEILQPIGFPVVIEETERPDVMHRQRRGLLTAVLTGIAIPFARCRSLPTPVVPAIVGMATAPAGIVRTSQHARPAPFDIAIPTTEGLGANAGGWPGDRSAANRARNRHFLTSYAFAVDLLPRCIALETAEGVCRHRCVVVLSLNSQSAGGTVHGFHTYIIPPLGDNREEHFPCQK